MKTNMAQKKQNAPSEIMIEDADIRWKNFSGAKGRFNEEGDRNFHLFLPAELAPQLEADGWNVKYWTPREEDAEPQAHLKVAVRYDGGRPPTVVLITSRGRTFLNEKDLPLVDYSDIKQVDLIVNPFVWSVNEKTGVKAYLKSIYITINEDPLALKYGGLDIAGEESEASAPPDWATE